MGNRMILLLLCCFLTGKIMAQNFEGEIRYQNKFDGKMIAGEMMEKLVGDELDYFIKEGKYKNTSNGSFMNYQVYDDKANRLYNKFPKSDTLFYYDGAENADSVIRIEHLNNADTVLGYPCDVVIITSKTSISRYAYSKKFPMNAAAYKKHAYANWNTYANASKSVPLKITVDSKYYKFTSTATAITPKKLNDQIFTIEGPTAKMK